MSGRISDLLDRIGAGEGIWLLAVGSLTTITGLVAFHTITPDQFVACFQRWAELVFGSAAIAGFRDWKKGTPNGPTP